MQQTIAIELLDFKGGLVQKIASNKTSLQQSFNFDLSKKFRGII
jgi:hypothetical protein